MIKISYSYTQDFLNDYEQKIINEKVIPSLHELIIEHSGNDKERVEKVFSDKFVKDLVLCSADKLYEKIDTIYNHLFELSERYCLEFYFKDITLDSSISSMPIRKRVDQEKIKTIHCNIITELKLLMTNRNSKLLPGIIKKMEVTTVASQIKTQLKNLSSMKSGNYKLSEEEIALFPDWVNSFDNVFNYDSMSKIFGREITNSLNLDICPYCNNEDIETINEIGAETRPDLDHFFPKSKFPFLALTLSNLIPAGVRCNQKYKKDKSMIGYVNPFLNGVNQETLFNFKYMFDQGRNIESINIEVKKLNNELDKNLDLFKVEETHNKNNVKNWFLLFEERYQTIINAGDNCLDEILADYNLIRQRLDVELDKPPTKEQYQKFKVDALNFLTGRVYKMPN
ncbi:hypothetical protein [Pseudoalteromonas luteoviolacea]|uniref:hypothetical protein n=1 Tax=Pseudoalteromonas luteoviolacea TaxID=43657 RepID=UPI001B37DE71|nr:hypothetical protein [Pseudoalteromonas luteoviolacea]MBQ4838700.1 hypothetical protein [Pseudoalteromonas luteoviolacea]